MTEKHRQTFRRHAARPPGRCTRRCAIGPVRNVASADAILDAAAAVLAEHGGHRFTLDSVAARAKTSKHTVYRWWGGKSALLCDVYERAGESALASPDAEGVEKRLLRYMSSLWSLWATTISGDAMRYAIIEAQRDDTSRDAFTLIFLARRERVIKRILLQGQARGEIAELADIDAAVSMLVGLSWRHLLTGELEQTRVLRAAVRMTIKGIAPDRSAQIERRAPAPT